MCIVQTAEQRYQLSSQKSSKKYSFIFLMIEQYYKQCTATLGT